ncbi:AMP-binding protein [Xanthomonas sp. MUS 060]|uniref:AMP-binding protein n=1 Tax=Xanthomonas sp. MUS 060 TaxID=1588031 RepID=UPI0006988A3C|nr:AMP-binding protein [Xanthomonas sp. MUS 060]
MTHANRLAHCLIERGLRPRERVALWFDRSPDFLIALLGVLKAGGCYVPLDPHYPTAYIQQILDDAQPRLLLCGKNIDGQLIQVPLLRLDDAAIARQPHTPLPHALHPAQMAYVMYTSGSTGRPKGVMVPHRQILNWLHALWARAPFEAGERVAQKTSIAFAISVKELLAGLLAGVPQVFIDEDTVRDIHPRFRARAGNLADHTLVYLSFPAQRAARPRCSDPLSCARWKPGGSHACIPFLPSSTRCSTTLLRRHSGWRDCASSSSPSNPARRNCCNGSGRCCLPARPGTSTVVPKSTT